MPASNVPTKCLWTKQLSTSSRRPIPRTYCRGYAPRVYHPFPPVRASRTDMPTGDLAEIGKYRIISQIGEGAMGVVYRGIDPVLNRPVAIKVMNDAVARDKELRARFLREAQSAGSLQHPNVVTVYDFGEVDGHPFIAMELVE